MSIYKRGDTYWYKFTWEGKQIRSSAKTTNDDKARNAEADRRSALAEEKRDRDKARARLECEHVRRCEECERLFNADNAILHEGHAVCCDACRTTWAKKHTYIPTLAEFIEKRFEPWAKATFEQSSPKTWLDWYRTGLRAIRGNERLASRKLDEITSEHSAEFAAQLQTEPLRNRPNAKAGLKVGSVNTYLRVLRRVLRMAAEWGTIESVPKIKLLRGEGHRERVVTPEEEARYLSAAPDLLSAVASVLVDTGMRPEECFRLRWESITWANGRNGMLQITHGKTAAARRLIPMTPRVRHVLEMLWEGQGKPEEGWIWPAETKSGHVESSSFKKQHKNTFAEINEKAQGKKLKPIRPWVLYTFRHTFLTRLGESGCDAWTLARIAGHSNISISQRYVHPSENAVLDAFIRLGGHKSGHKQLSKS